MTGCRWPIPDPEAPGQMKGCGQPKARGAYCEGHAVGQYQVAPSKSEVEKWIKQTMFTVDRRSRR